MDGLAWNYAGTKLYASSGSSLWVYADNKLQLACENVVAGKIEGLDMQPNGFLLIGVDNAEQKATSILAYDPESCRVVHEKVYTDYQLQ